MQLLPGPQGLLASPAPGSRVCGSVMTAAHFLCRRSSPVHPAAFWLVFTSPTSPPASLPRSLLCTPPAAAPALEGQPSIHAPAPCRTSSPGAPRLPGVHLPLPGRLAKGQATEGLLLGPGPCVALVSPLMTGSNSGQGQPKGYQAGSWGGRCLGRGAGKGVGVRVTAAIPGPSKQLGPLGQRAVRLRGGLSEPGRRPVVSLELAPPRPCSFRGWARKGLPHA